MNPIGLTLSFVAQLVLLQWTSPWSSGALSGIAVGAVFALFAFSRLRWGAHLDMYLAMMGWGGLGMMLPTLFTGMPCNHSFHWWHYCLMSVGMWAFALPPIWQQARCVAQARKEGRGITLLLLDGLGMQIGMGLAHLPLVWLPMGDVRVAWFSQALMMLGMGLGMMAAQWWMGEWESQDIVAMG